MIRPYDFWEGPTPRRERQGAPQSPSNPHPPASVLLSRKHRITFSQDSLTTMTSPKSETFVNQHLKSHNQSTAGCLELICCNWSWRQWLSRETDKGFILWLLPNTRRRARPIYPSTGQNPPASPHHHLCTTPPPTPTLSPPHLHLQPQPFLPSSTSLIHPSSSSSSPSSAPHSIHSLISSHTVCPAVSTDRLDSAPSLCHCLGAVGEPSPSSRQHQMNVRGGGTQHSHSLATGTLWRGISDSGVWKESCRRCSRGKGKRSRRRESRLPGIH